MTHLPHTPTVPAGIYTFFATREYFEQLIQDIATTETGDRVLLASMGFDANGTLMQTLLSELSAAATRGVDITLQIDAYNFLSDGHFRPGPLLWRNTIPTKMATPFRNVYEPLMALEAAGVKLVITNMPGRRFTVPFAGRSHIKCSIINDKIYLGGCNIDEQNLDCMVSWRDHTSADWIYHLLQKRLAEPRSLQAFGTQDLHHKTPDASEIIVDVGVRRQSAIYERALEIIDGAEEWIIITCQFFPNSLTAKHLRQAHDRGVKVYPIFNHYSAHDTLSQPLQHAVTARERLHMPRQFFDTELPAGTTYLHAKILATESQALIGSHNYVTAGVNFGTAEIAIHHKTAEFSRACAQLIAKETGLDDRPAFGFLRKK
ncbi:MAG: phospholipase D-like domain-containing protein [Candidatus Saccharibacteria bacterium]